MIAASSEKQGAAESFWRFSLMLYGRPGVAAALIGLQDRAGHNVNLILFAVWLAIGYASRLDVAGVMRARAAIGKLDGDVVLPLRNLRRALKSDSDHDVQALRQRILALEIASERRVQARLAETFAGRSGKGSRAALVEANLRAVLGADFDSSEAAALRQAIAGL